MRERVSRPRAGTSIASRRGGSVLMRALSCLLSLALVLQVATFDRHQPRGALPPNDKAIALATLGEAIGQVATICAHDQDSPDRHDGDGPVACEHCTFCHAVTVAFVPVPAMVGVPRLVSSSEAGSMPDDAAPARPRPSGSATPRGPPALG